MLHKLKLNILNNDFQQSLNIIYNIIIEYSYHINILLSTIFYTILNRHKF